MKIHPDTPNSAQFKTHKLLISEMFQLIFSDCRRQNSDKEEYSTDALYADTVNAFKMQRFFWSEDLPEEKCLMNS